MGGRRNSCSTNINKYLNQVFKDPQALKEAVQDRKKWRMLVEEKTRNRERTNVKRTQEKAMANHSQTVILASKIHYRISRNLNRLEGLILGNKYSRHTATGQRKTYFMQPKLPTARQLVTASFYLFISAYLLEFRKQEVNVENGIHTMTSKQPPTVF